MRQSRAWMLYKFLVAGRRPELLIERVSPGWEGSVEHDLDAAYWAFGRHVGGSSEEITAHRRLYVDELRCAVDRTGRLPVVDVGCGRGEMMRLLAAAGVPAIGVEPSPSRAAELRDQSLEIEQSDANRYLADQADGSLAAVVSFNVLEHMTPDYALEFLHLIGRKVAPGGMVALLTSNPECVAEMGVFWVDPTHVRPYHAKMVASYLATFGFVDLRIDYVSPARLGLSGSGERSSSYRSYTVVGLRGPSGGAGDD